VPGDIAQADAKGQAAGPRAESRRFNHAYASPEEPPLHKGPKPWQLIQPTTSRPGELV